LPRLSARCQFGCWAISGCFVNDEVADFGASAFADQNPKALMGCSLRAPPLAGAITIEIGCGRFLMLRKTSFWSATQYWVGDPNRANSPYHVSPEAKRI
jgi:hypothetical protein